VHRQRRILLALPIIACAALGFASTAAFAVRPALEADASGEAFAPIEDLSTPAPDDFATTQPAQPVAPALPATAGTAPARPDPVRDLIEQLPGHPADATTPPADPASTVTAPALDAAPTPAAGLPAMALPAAVLPAAVSPTSALPASTSIWERIRAGFKINDLENQLSTNRTQWYAAQPDYIGRMAGRASMYLFYIVEEIEKRGLPMELALLPFVESAMQPEATSNAMAAGLWQFIPSTGRLYSLEQSPWKDDRRDVIESTRAALDYLQRLYAEFNDWQLALAAYNCGEIGVERALARARASHRPLDYSDLRLPRETQWYVPKLQAIKNIIRDPAHYGIDLPAVPNEPYFVVVNRSRDIDVVTAARLADMPIDQFRALNPSFSRPVIVAASSSNILLPADRAGTFSANLAAWESTGQALSNWTTYKMQAGETLAAIARRVGVGEAQLRDANRIPPRYRLGAGSTILIPRDETMDGDIDADSLAASFTLIPEFNDRRRVTYRVRNGDTLQTVARRWGVRADDLVAWNSLQSDTLFAGQRLNVLAVARSAKRSTRKVTAARKTVRSINVAASSTNPHPSAAATR
jgi:membrane-bound lytic murein transglycosylase D